MTEEGYKGLVHAAGAALAATMLLHTGLRIAQEKRVPRHLAANLVVYGLLWPFETYQTYRHWKNDAPRDYRTTP